MTTDTKAQTQITAEPGIPQIIITREFDAPAELLYRAHTEPDLLSRWLGPRRLQMRIERMDVRDGGTYRFIHSGEDGTEHAFHGVFHGVPSIADGIIRTFEYEGAPGHVSLETATFQERDGRTTVVASAVYQSVEDRDAMIDSGMDEGVYDGYDRLDELMASLKGGN